MAEKGGHLMPPREQAHRGEKDRRTQGFWEVSASSS
jgi:hypothetical protein